MQLRDFLQKSLYDSDQGYFTAARGVVPVGSVGRPLPFPQLAGEEGYRRAVREVYDTLEVSSLFMGSLCLQRPCLQGSAEISMLVLYGSQ